MAKLNRLPRQPQQKNAYLAAPECGGPRLTAPPPPRDVEDAERDAEPPAPRPEPVSAADAAAAAAADDDEEKVGVPAGADRSPEASLAECGSARLRHNSSVSRTKSKPAGR